jgi:hypothetical protein
MSRREDVLFIHLLDAICKSCWFSRTMFTSYIPKEDTQNKNKTFTLPRVFGPRVRFVYISYPVPFSRLKAPPLLSASALHVSPSLVGPLCLEVKY